MIRELLLITALIALVGLIDGQSLQSCIAAGNSPETCQNVME